MPKPKSEKSEVQKTKDRLTADTPRKPPIPDADWLSSGVTIVNLRCTGHPDRFVSAGTYVYIVGDSASGKTFWAFNLFAEAALNRRYDKHRFIYDPTENGMLADVPGFFGSAVATRIEPPAVVKKQPRYSNTVQDFYYHLDAALDGGPVIYVEDSMDGLVAEEDEAAFAAARSKHETGTGKVPGSYGMEKAKYNSKNINRVVKKLRDTGSILVILSQTREKIGGPIPGMKTRAGGKALRFYAHMELWTAAVGPIKETARGTGGYEVEIGSNLTVDVRKNRVSGCEGSVDVPFLRTHGFDDLGACVDWLLEVQHWEKTKGIIDAPEFGVACRREELIRAVQEQDRDRELQLLTADVWRKIETAVRPVRKPRYI